jgi:predicted GNAT family N-acyltransferase
MEDQAIEYRVIGYCSPDYEQTLELRDACLRRPWGTSIADDDLSGEEDDFIYGAFQGTRLVGMAILQDRGDRWNKLRYMAVDQDFRRLGIGSVIARAFETRSRAAGKAGIRLAARTHVVAFYESLGYKLDGQPFVPDHIPIPHIHMILRFDQGSGPHS